MGRTHISRRSWPTSIPTNDSPSRNHFLELGLARCGPCANRSSFPGDGALPCSCPWLGLCGVLFRDKILALAKVAELADALALGASARKGVRVRLPPFALNFVMGDG